MPSNVAEMMEGLYAMSVQDGIGFGRVQILFDAEADHADTVLQFKGHLALSDAFKCLFLESVEQLNVDVRPKVQQALPQQYVLCVPRLAQSFQALCASERVAIHGYPYQAYTLLRNVFDNLILTSAALQRITDFYQIDGLASDGSFDPTKARKLRKATEFETRKYMTGANSGLRPETVALLAKWDALFDSETHGARLSATHAVDFMRGLGPLPVVPKFDEDAFALFMNRYSEVAWMLHRLVPVLQPGIPFSTAWSKKWDFLDACFEMMVVSLSTKLGKPIGTAMVEFVKAKFPFSSTSLFCL